MPGIVHSTLREQIADAIKIMVIKHELEPGMRIKEAEIAHSFGVSHGPVREALRQLEQEGIVEYIRNAGCSVRSITTEEIIEVLMLRCNIEYIAVKACNGQFSDEVLADFEEVLQMMNTAASDDADPEEIDSRFHRLLITNADMPHLTRTWDSLEYVMTFTFSNIDNFDDYRAMLFYDNHKRIYDAFESRNMSRIVSAIHEHYMSNITKMMEASGITQEDLGFSLAIIEPVSF